MEVERLSIVLPVDDLAAAVRTWRGLLGAEPTFVDGDRWAQFDLGGARLSLAGTDRVGDEPAVMLKVADLRAACARARELGLDVSEPERGPHELRATVRGGPGATAVLYAPP